jgi:hypothetical protein
MSGLRTWTSEDDALLRNLAASGESTTAIAKRLERSSPEPLESRRFVSRFRLGLGAEQAKTHQRPFLSHLEASWVGRTIWES